MIRKLLLGFAASAALGLGLLAAPAPASAQSWSITIGSGHRPVVPVGDFYRPVGPGWGRGDGWGRGGGWGPHGGWGRPHHPHFGGGWGGPQHCFVRPVRVWDGWGWSVRPKRICR